MQPVDPYDIHIIVKNGRTMLLGVVDGTADRQIAEVRAREVTGVFEVENGLIVPGTGQAGDPARPCSMIETAYSGGERSCRDSIA